MKRLTITLSAALLSLTAMAGNVSAQGYDRRVDAARVAVAEGRAYRSERDNWNRGDGDRRASQDLDRLNREVREVRVAIGDSHRTGQRIRDRFRRVLTATEHLNARFRRGDIRGWEVRRRADEIRGDLERVRRDLRRRHIGLGGWR